MHATFVTLAAYDWRMLPQSIASYYAYADRIIVGLAADRISWNGVPFELDRGALDAALDAIDPDHKIQVIEGYHFEGSTSAVRNDSRQREWLMSCVPEGDWVVEVDADEVLTDVPTLFAAMEACPEGHQVYAADWDTVYKVIGDTALVITPSLQPCALATRSRTRNYARQTGEPVYLAPITVNHYSMARSEAELTQKLSSWSHSSQVRSEFLDRWRSVSLENYQDAKNLHYRNPSTWPGLRAAPLTSLEVKAP